MCTQDPCSQASQEELLGLCSHDATLYYIQIHDYADSNSFLQISCMLHEQWNKMKCIILPNLCR